MRLWAQLLVNGIWLKMPQNAVLNSQVMQTVALICIPICNANST